MSSVGRLMSVASRRERLASLRITHRVSRRECFVPFLRLVSRLVSSSRSYSSRFALVVIRGGETARAWRGVDVLVIMRSGRRRSCSRISDWLGWSIGPRRFIQLDFSYSHQRGRVRAHGVMVSIWDELVLWKMTTARA